MHFEINDPELLERLEAYRRRRRAPSMEEALRRVLLNYLPTVRTDEEHARLLERMELRERRARQAILNQAVISEGTGPLL